MRSFFEAITRLLSIIFVALLILACIGPWIASAMYLSRYGIVTDGIVIQKDEFFKRQSSSNDWSRFLTIMVRYTPDDSASPIEVKLNVDRQRYDDLTMGSVVQVRYAPNPTVRRLGGLGTTLADRTPVTFVTHLFDNSWWLSTLLFIVSCIMAIGIYRSRSVVLRVGMGIILIVTIGAGVVASIRPTSLFEPGAHATATAHVRSIERITVNPGTTESPSEPLIRPLHRVQLVFTPAGNVDTVVAIDDIDENSVAGLVEGQEVTVTYWETNPRSAHIVAATRNHRYLNWLMIPRDFALIALIFAAFFGVGFIGKLLLRKATRRATP